MLVILTQQPETFQVQSLTEVPKWEEGIEIASGIIYGVTKGDHLTEIQTCMKDSAKFAKEVETAVLDLWHWDHDMRNIINAFYNVARAVRTMKQDIAACGDMGGDW